MSRYGNRIVQIGQCTCGTTHTRTTERGEFVAVTCSCGITVLLAPSRGDFDCCAHNTHGGHS